MYFGRRGYAPDGSGILCGSGEIKHYRSRFLISLKDTARIKAEVEDFIEGKEYTEDEIILLTEKILLMDPKPPGEYPMWLNGDMFYRRARREIYCNEGAPDPSVVSGLYWRSHPNGRKLESKQNRKEHGASYYKD